MIKPFVVLIIGCLFFLCCDKQLVTAPSSSDANCRILKTAIVIKIKNEIPLFEFTYKSGTIQTGYDSLDILNRKYSAKSMALQFTNKTNESPLYGYYYIKFRYPVDVDSAVIDYSRLSIIEKAGTSGTCSTPN